MTLESGPGPTSARAPFEAGFFSRPRRDQAERAQGAAVSLDGAAREAAAPPVPPPDPSARAGEDQTRRAPDPRSGQLLSFDAIAALQGEAEAGGVSPGGPDGLDEAERAEVRALEKADREVRAHERAHAAAGG